jgi:AmmeMemoRadiSam system protein B
MNNILFGALMPHPPIVVPPVGRGKEKEAAKTIKALSELANRLKKSNCDTVIVITPHGAIGQASVPVYTGHVFEGDFNQFGAVSPKYSFKGDTELALAIIKDSGLATSCPETLLDHGLLVPLHFVKAAGYSKMVLPIAIAFQPLAKLFEFGQNLKKTINRLNRQVAVIASADMSHCLTPDAPNGFSPRGQVFDDKLVELVKNYDVNGIINFDRQLAEDGKQDALWSLAILLGALDGLNVQPQVLSYEGPFGVGYLVASFFIC